MENVVYLWEWKRARLGRDKRPILSPRTPRSRTEGGRLSFVRIGDAAADVVRRLE